MILEDVRFALDWDENLAPGKSPPSFADFAEAGLAREGRLFGGWEAPHFTRMELEASAQCETRRQIRLDNEEIFAIQKADAALAAARRAGDERAILAAEEAVRAKLQLRTELEKLSLNALKTRAEIRGCPDDEIDEEALSGVDNPKVALVEVIMAHVDILWLQKAAEKTLGTKGTKALWKEVALLKGKRVIAPRHRSLSDLIFVILSRQSDAKAIERDDGFAMISSEKYAYYRLERTLKEVQTHTERLRCDFGDLSVRSLFVTSLVWLSGSRFGEFWAQHEDAAAASAELRLAELLRLDVNSQPYRIHGDSDLGILSNTGDINFAAAAGADCCVESVACQPLQSSALVGSTLARRALHGTP